MRKHPPQRHRQTRKPDEAPAHARRPRFSREVRVLYEDDAVVVLDKPAGLLSVPIRRSNTPSALSLVSASLEAQGQRAFVVHRIDRFASGILLFAKSHRDRAALVSQFLEHTPRREYLAVVRGRVEKPAGTLVHYFRREGFVQQLCSPKDREATRAELLYSVERLFADASLVKVELVTGLQNQIRAQFAAIGHPVIGDRKYHRAEVSESQIDRVALHAAHLDFAHPRSGETVSIDCEVPPDIRHLLRQLS